MSAGLSRVGKTGIIIAAALALAIIVLTVVLVMTGREGNPSDTVGLTSGSESAGTSSLSHDSSGNGQITGTPSDSGNSSSDSDKTGTEGSDSYVTSKPADTSQGPAPDTSGDNTAPEKTDVITTEEPGNVSGSGEPPEQTENPPETSRERENETSSAVAHTDDTAECTSSPMTSDIPYVPTDPPMTTVKPEEPSTPPEQTTGRPPEDVTSADTTKVSPPDTTGKVPPVHTIVPGTMGSGTPTTTRPKIPDTMRPEVTTRPDPESITPETEPPRSPNEDAAPGVVVVPELRNGETLRDTLVAPNGDKVPGEWRNSGGNISFKSDLPKLATGEKYRWWLYEVDYLDFFFGTYEEWGGGLAVFNPDTPFPVIDVSGVAHTEQEYTVPPGTWW